MHDAAVFCMLLLLVLFSGIEGRSSKLSNIYVCIYMLVGTWWCSRAESGRGCYDGGVGRPLELKPGSVCCERALFHPDLFWVLRGAAPSWYWVWRLFVPHHACATASAPVFPCLALGCSYFSSKALSFMCSLSCLRQSSVCQVF